MTLELTRIMLNSYVQGEYSHGFDIGYVKSEYADDFIEKLKEKFKDEKHIQYYVFEKEKEKPVSIHRMALKIVAELESKTVDYIDNSVPNGIIYEVLIKKYDSENQFDHILDFGTMFVSKEQDNIEEIEKTLLKDLSVNLSNSKLKVKKVKLKTIDSLIEKVNEIIF